MTTESDPLERTARGAALGTAAVGGVFAALALGFFGARVGVGVLVGALIGGANFWGLAWIVRGFVVENASRFPLTLFALLKLLVLFGGIYLLVREGVVDILPLVVGYGALPIGIALSQRAPQPALKKG